MDFYVPAISIEFLHVSLDLVRRSAAEHARGVHNRASRKLHESVLLGCLSIAASMKSFLTIPIDVSGLSYYTSFLAYGFLWISYGFLWISYGFLWISVDSHPIPYDFLMRCGHFLWISFDFLWISLDFCRFASNSIVISLRFVATSYGFLLIFYGILWISLDWHPIPCDFFMRCGRFLWISLDFRWISLDFNVPVVAVELLHISWDLVRRSAAEHARDVHHRASRKLDESVLLGCLAISLDFFGLASNSM